jgi:L-ribulokinase
MSEHGVTINRVINAGGIPQKNDVLNQVYADILGRPVLVPSSTVVGVGAAIFAFLAAGTFKTVEEAQARISPSHRVFQPRRSEQAAYGEIYSLFRRLYFALGDRQNGEFGDVLPALIRLKEAVRTGGDEISSS